MQPLKAPLRPVVTALAITLLLSACATPVPGPNLAATRVQAPADVALATAPTAGQEANAVVADQIAIEFPLGSAALTREADRKQFWAARLYRDANPALMFTTGHADKLGDEYANLLLSARRAQAVKLGLVARGIPADRLLLRAMGTSDPASAADPAAAANRRVVVTWRLI
jgi:outer membrane protein OmpA-like peptidoglycan-associated protein